MSMIKRITTTLYSQIDRVVGEIENHDALIKAAIAEQGKRIAAARVQHNRIRASEEKVSRQLEELKQNEKLWAERAIRAAAEDEQRALACLQRRQAVRDQIARVEEARTAYQRTAAKMAADIGRCEQELRAMSQKHELMRARQTSVDASRFAGDFTCSGLDELESSFDRWELKLAQGEMTVEDTGSVDTLEQEYLTAEKEQQLRAELAELLSKENDHGNA